MTIPDAERARMLRSAVSSLHGNDLERARMAFRGMSPEQMQQQHGQSGQTRQQILDGYAAHRTRTIAASELLESMLKERGL